MRCETCKWFEAMSDHEVDGGDCRRYAPRHILVDVEQKEAVRGFGDHAFWPQVKYDDWCGEYEEYGEAPA